FQQHPSGIGLVATATKEGEIVGVNAFMPAGFNLGVDSILGYQSMDTIVSPAARGLGVFNKLINCFYEHSDAGLLYGFPNLNSSPGFFGKLGWTYFGPAPMLFRPLRTGYFLKKISAFLPDIGVPLLSRPLEKVECI